MSDNTLTQMIDQLVLEKTVSLDALNAINGLKSKAQQLEDQLNVAHQRHERDEKTIGGLHDRIKAIEEQFSFTSGLLKQREEQIKSMQAQELAGTKAVAELKGFTAAMEMVFKPAAVREQIQRNVAVPVTGSPGGNGGYPTPGFVTSATESEVITRTQE